jgi:hypothetical protein
LPVKGVLSVGQDKTSHLTWSDWFIL